MKLWSRPKGLSMVEMMITVVIISTCLIFILKGFSIAAAACSRAYFDMTAQDILEERMAGLLVRSLEGNGVSRSSQSENIRVKGRDLLYTEEIQEYGENRGVDEKKNGPDRLPLCEAVLSVNWSRRPGGGGVSVRAVIPAKGFRDKL